MGKCSFLPWVTCRRADLTPDVGTWAGEGGAAQGLIWAQEPICKQKSREPGRHPHYNPRFYASVT